MVGPTLYAIIADELAAADLAADLRSCFALGRDEVLITRADNLGSSVVQVEPAPPTRRV